MASKRRNVFYQKKKQETTEIDGNVGITPHGQPAALRRSRWAKGVRKRPDADDVCPDGMFQIRPSILPHPEEIGTNGRHLPKVDDYLRKVAGSKFGNPRMERMTRLSMAELDGRIRPGTGASYSSLSGAPATAGSSAPTADRSSAAAAVSIAPFARLISGSASPGIISGASLCHILSAYDIARVWEYYTSNLPSSSAVILESHRLIVVFGYGTSLQELLLTVRTRPCHQRSHLASATPWLAILVLKDTEPIHEQFARPPLLQPAMGSK
ncbi:hypothetical protein AAG570_009084 [Ranatra chinensis]|uniref:Uncharacterized protein n=1 Tax=Ranatra chinensis TaxID=642074 RepID=A0ABD0YSQ4_9HEMI